jgi:isocitrate dehydrogenase (NAD+)
MMLRHIGDEDAANRLEKSLAAVIKENANVTYDLKPDRTGGVGTSQMADAIIAGMGA